MLPSIALGHPHRAARAGEDVELLLIDIRCARVEGETFARTATRIDAIERRDLVGAGHVAVEEALAVFRPLTTAASTDAAEARRVDRRRRHRARGLRRYVDHVARRALVCGVARERVRHDVRG